MLDSPSNCPSLYCDVYNEHQLVEAYLWIICTFSTKLKGHFPIRIFTPSHQTELSFKNNRIILSPIIVFKF
jgi:hypothetical protein